MKCHSSLIYFRLKIKYIYDKSGDEYKHAIATINNADRTSQAKPSSVHGAFRNTEWTTEFTTRLRGLAKDCEFKDIEIEILQFIVGIDHTEVQSKCIITESRSLVKATEIATRSKRSRSRIEKFDANVKGLHRRGRRSMPLDTTNATTIHPATCRNCGRSKHERLEECSSKVGHFAQFCRSVAQANHVSESI